VNLCETHHVSRLALCAALAGALVLVVEAPNLAGRGSASGSGIARAGPGRWGLWYGLIFAILLLGVESHAQFIYFQF